MTWLSNQVVVFPYGCFKILSKKRAVHRSPKFFYDLNAFLPERFLDAEGKFIASDSILPFSVGCRRCVGEQLGRMEVLLILTHIVSKFNILPDDAGPKLSLGEGMLSITYAPEKFRVKFVERLGVNVAN